MCVNPSKVHNIFPTLTLASSSTARDSSSYSCKQDDVVLLCSAYVVLVRLCDGDGDGDGGDGEVMGGRRKEKGKGLGEEEQPWG